MVVQREGCWGLSVERSVTIAGGEEEAESSLERLEANRRMHGLVVR